MRRLLVYLHPYRGLVALSVAFLLLHSVLQIAGPLLTKVAIDRYLEPNPSRGGTPLDPYLSADPFTGIAQVALLYLAILVGVFVFEFAQSMVMQYTGQRAMFDLRRQLMGHLQELDIAFYDRNPVGRLVWRRTTAGGVL
jgi:ATP-binding cassette subfamily B protein